MLNPRENVSQLTLNDPQLAAPLLDFILWMATTPDVTKTDEYEEIVNQLYCMIADFESSKNRYIKSRLVA